MRNCSLSLLIIIEIEYSNPSYFISCDFAGDDDDLDGFRGALFKRKDFIDIEADGM